MLAWLVGVLIWYGGRRGGICGECRLWCAFFIGVLVLGVGRVKVDASLRSSWH